MKAILLLVLCWGAIGCADEATKGDQSGPGDEMPVEPTPDPPDPVEPTPDPPDPVEPTLDPVDPSLDEGPGAFQADFATSPAFFTRMSAPEHGLPGSPHSGEAGFVQIYYSTNIQPVITSAAFEAPVGTVAIKTQDPDGDGIVDNIMVMIKQPSGTDEATSDWLYERYRADATLELSGGSKLAFCAGCHNGYPDTSQLGGTSLEN